MVGFTARKEYLVRKHASCILQACMSHSLLLDLRVFINTNSVARMIKARKYYRKTRELFLVVQTGMLGTMPVTQLYID